MFGKKSTATETATVLLHGSCAAGHGHQRAQSHTHEIGSSGTATASDTCPTPGCSAHINYSGSY